MSEDEDQIVLREIRDLIDDADAIVYYSAQFIRSSEHGYIIIFEGPGKVVIKEWVEISGRMASHLPPGLSGQWKEVMSIDMSNPYLFDKVIDAVMDIKRRRTTA